MYPVIVKKIIYPAYRSLRRDELFSKINELDKNQWLPKQEIDEQQWRKLRLLLDNAYKNVPYYTELFNEISLKPEDVQGPGDFSRIPILTKEVINKNVNRIIMPDHMRKGVAANTGGSTGETLYFNKDVVASSYNQANLIRLNRWCGVDIGDKEAAFWGTPFDDKWTSKLSEQIKKYMKNVIELSTFDMSEETMLKYADIIRKFNPKLLRGYPSALFAFANFLKSKNIKNIRPQAIISTGEKTFSFQKEMMEEVFGPVVFERYGSNEFGNIAHECSEHHGLHLINDMYYVEVLKDGNPVEKGDVGEVVVTSLYNYYMPLIRYKIGDLAVLSDVQCSCGRGFPLMEGIEGRSFDMITTPSGKNLGGFFWTFISRAVVGIKQFQVVQKEKGSVEFKIVPDKSFTMESQKRLEEVIRGKVGQDLKVNIKIVNDIPLSPSGKFRFIISDISKERLVMKSKIHKAVVTKVDLNNIDSIIVDEELMIKANLKEYEKVLIVDNTNGARMETFIQKGKKGSGTISINGAMTHLINKGDEIIIMSFTWTDEDIQPKAILVDESNKFDQYL